MRINGYFDTSFIAPFVVAEINLKKLSIVDSMKFLIDTGASKTTISDNDAIKLGIDYSELKQSETGTTGIGGTVDTYTIEDVELTFKTDDTHTEKLDRIFVLKHKVLDERIKRIPSLLGRDILNKYKFVMNKEKNEVFITDKTG